MVSELLDLRRCAVGEDLSDPLMDRVYPAPYRPSRRAFQRDRERVVQARAFRRLAGKTQVFTSRASDHFRSRLTHTIEVAEIARAAVPADVDRRLQAAVASFVGAIEQVPPMFSAVHHHGQRLHELARAGVTVERAKRPVTIYALSVLGREGYTVRMRVACSEGTYVRTLCEDLARACGTVGHMGALLREASGPFVLYESLTLDEVAANPLGSLVPPERVIPIPTVVLDGRRATDFRAGRVVPLDEPSADKHVFVRDSARVLVGVGETVGALLAPRKVFL